MVDAAKGQRELQSRKGATEGGLKFGRNSPLFYRHAERVLAPNSQHARLSLAQT